jgi:NADP-dependent 3-hydroxy acid dehydrogenase YdfG
MTARPLALITGGSSGIGAATAATLAADGWRVVVVARGAAALHTVRDRLVATGGTVMAEVADASDGAAVLALAERIVAEHGVPNAIVNAAGAGEWRFAEETEPALAVQMMGAPYQAAFNTTSAFLPGMLQRGSGVLIHVGSPGAFVPWPGATAYVAARWALRGLHEALRQDLRGTGVSTSHVVFGEVTSPYFETNAVGRDQLPWLSRVVPAISPDQCAAVILDTIRTPRPQVIHPPLVRALVRAGRAVPPLGRRLAAWGARSH